MALNHLKSATMVLFFLIMWCTAQGVFPYCYQGICYQLSENTLDYNLSISYCEKIGGVLASIHSLEQNQFIWNSVCDVDNCWIGLHDVDMDGSWEWVDGSAYDYENWWKQADVSYEYFGVAIVIYQLGLTTFDDGDWYNRPKSSWFRAVCMTSTPPTPSPTPSPSTTDAPTLSTSTTDASTLSTLTIHTILLSVISVMLIFLLVLNVCVLYRQTFIQRQASIELGEQ